MAAVNFKVGREELSWSNGQEENWVICEQFLLTHFSFSSLWAYLNLIKRISLTESWVRVKIEFQRCLKRPLWSVCLHEVRVLVGTGTGF